MNLLEVRGLKVAFENEKGEDLVVVDGVDLSLESGQTLGLVGESGCGKSVSALSLLRLLPHPAGKILNGSILWKNVDLLSMSSDQIRSIRGKEIGMIFQEPMNALNPSHTIGRQVDEVFLTHREMKQAEAREHTLKMLQKVGIPEPNVRANDYPHQLSGGMRQRIVIAMALACEPDLIIADEPTTALDVTIQAQVLQLMSELQEQSAASLLLITHDLGVVAQTCDEVAVMYAGRIVERAPVSKLFQSPKHAYTRGLLASIPSLTGPVQAKLPVIQGMVPALADLNTGCRFAPRSTHHHEQEWLEVRPSFVEVEENHWVEACPACAVLNKKDLS